MFDHNIRDGVLNRHPALTRSLNKSSFNRTNDCHPQSAHLSSGFLSGKVTGESDKNLKDQLTQASEISRSPSLPSFVHSPTVSTGPVTA